MPFFEYSILQMILFGLTVIIASRFGYYGLFSFWLNPMLIVLVGELCFTEACQKSTGWYEMVLTFATVINLPVTLVGFGIGLLLFDKDSKKPKGKVYATFSEEMLHDKKIQTPNANRADSD